MRHNRNARHGFSLIELMVTLAIAAILLTVALPSLRGLVGEERITGVTNELVYALQLSRSEAIKRAGPVRLCPSRAPLAVAPVCAADSFADGWIVLADDDGNGVLGAGDRVILQREARGDALVFTPGASLAGGVQFDAGGNSVTAAGAPNPGTMSISLPDGSDRRNLSVRASGRILSTRPAP